MSEENEVYITNNDNTKVLLLAQKLKYVVKELNKLPEEDLKLVIEKVDKENSWALKELYNKLNEYMGW